MEGDLANSISVLSVIGVAITAVATLLLWRVTSTLAIETKLMAAAASQPQIVVTIEPSPWALMYANLHIANTGNATAFDISVNFDPPLVLIDERKEKERPFQTLSLLRPGQNLKSWIGKLHPLIEKNFYITVSWRRSPGGTEEQYSYWLSMGDYRAISQLGASDPTIQIAQKLKLIQEDFRKITSGSQKLGIDIYDSRDRQAEEAELRAFWEEASARKQTDE